MEHRPIYSRKYEFHFIWVTYYNKITEGKKKRNMGNIKVKRTDFKNLLLDWTDERIPIQSPEFEEFERWRNVLKKKKWGSCYLGRDVEKSYARENKLRMNRNARKEIEYKKPESIFG